MLMEPRRDVAEEPECPSLAGLLAGVACRLERAHPRVQRAVGVAGEQESLAELREQQAEPPEEADRLGSAHRLPEQPEASLKFIQTDVGQAQRRDDPRE